MSRNEDLELILEPDGRADRRAGEGGWSLFDLGRDPDQVRDLLSGRPPSGEVDAAFERLSAELGTALAPYAAPKAGQAGLSEEQRDRLRDSGSLD